MSGLVLFLQKRNARLRVLKENIFSYKGPKMMPEERSVRVAKREVSVKGNALRMSEIREGLFVPCSAWPGSGCHSQIAVRVQLLVERTDSVVDPAANEALEPGQLIKER